MSETGSSGIGRIYIKAGSEEIDLSGSAREVSDAWLRMARQEAINQAMEIVVKSGIPERGSAFRRLLDTCGVEKKGDIILAAIHYLRSVERESDTPPRDVRRLIAQSGKWDEDEVEKWNLSLYINRMLDGSSPLLEYPEGKNRKNRFVVLTNDGVDHLESMSL